MYMYTQLHLNEQEAGAGGGGGYILGLSRTSMNKIVKTKYS